VGADARVRGTVWVHGKGRIDVGERVVFDAADAPIELHAAAGSTVAIGDDCTLAGGTAIDATHSIVIGARCRIGPFCRLMDNHFHALRGDRQARPTPAPIVVEDDVELGACAILLPGAHVCRGSRIRPRAVIRRRVAIVDRAHRAPMTLFDVSVVVSMVRRTELLIEAIRGALATQDVAVEVIVVDASPEGAARRIVAGLHDDRVVYVRRATPSHARPSAMRDDGWPRARGRYVHFLDEDGVVAPGTLGAHVAALDARPLCATSFGVVSPPGAPCLVRRSALEEEGGLDRAVRERGRVFVDQGTGRSYRAARGLAEFLALRLTGDADVTLARRWRGA
jgi:acetyltransferase-like isoleucine patch superfamily enzyme